MTTQTYDFLDDPREREWLIGLDPKGVLANAHRVYDWMEEQGIDPDSFLRELAFIKASEALGIDYDVFYDAWLNQTPVGGRHCGSPVRENAYGHSCDQWPLCEKVSVS